ncbi:hypothetical protein BsWGS_02150 [Bradybaena similaris]
MANKQTEAENIKHQHAKEIQDLKDRVEEEKRESRERIEQLKNEWKKEVPRHKKYQGLIKSYTKEDEIASWLRNLESILRDEKIPKEDWAFILRKCLTGEPLKVIEAVSDESLNDYRYLKGLLEQHFKITQMGQREKFQNIKPRANQTFMDFVAEVRLTLENWIKSSGANCFDTLKDLIVKDKILSATPHRLATFLIEQGVQDLNLVIQHGTAFCEANKDIFESGLTAELNIGAAASFHAKQKWDRLKHKKVGFTSSRRKAPWRGNISECKYCHISHGENEMCESNPEYKRFAQKHIKSISNRNSRYTPKQKCWCCHTIGHFSASCPCRHAKQVANFSCGDETDNSDESYETTDSETMHDIQPKGNACEVMKIEDIQKCEVCREFHESAKLYCGHEVPITLVEGNALESMKGKLNIVPGFVNNVRVNVLRDTGSTLVGVCKKLVRPKDYTGEHIICRTFGGEQQRYPIAWIKISSPYITARVKSAVLPNPCTELIIGNIPNVVDVDVESIEQWKLDNKCITSVSNAVTRQQSAKLQKENEQPIIQLVPIDPHTDNKQTTQKVIYHHNENTPLKVEQTTTTQNDNAPLPTLQQQDETLQKCWQMVNHPDKQTKCAVSKFVVLKKVLYRLHQTGTQVTKQIVLPQQHRQKVFELAHSSSFGGHMGIHKTLARIQQHYHWPGVTSDVKAKCKSCNQCQVTRPEGKFPKATIQITDVPARPFQKVAIDIIGPMSVPSDKGNRYILTLVDLCTRWPEAIPLRNITSETIAEALLLIFSRIGFPNTILSDNGPQFVSQVTKLVMSKLGIKQVFATPYHPQTNGTCERFNGTLKTMLGKVAFNNPASWDIILPAVLFAFREVPQEATKFSPFERVYGANPRGPLCLYKELLLDSELSAENRSSYDLVTNLRERIIKSCNIASKATERAHQVNRKYKNVNRKIVSFNKGELVMLLLPKKCQKLLVEWQGPFTIVEKVSDVDYKVQVKGKAKVFHINMIAKYHVQNVIKTDRADNMLVIHDNGVDQQQKENTRQKTICEGNTVVSDSDIQDDLLDIIEPVTVSKTTYKDVNIGTALTTDQRRQVNNLLKKYAEIFSEIPGKSKFIMHHIKVTTDTPIRVKPYVIPEHYKEKVEAEIKELERLQIIQRSNSSYASSMVVIRKKDDTLRICIDYRKLNQVTVTDAEPIPGADELISNMSLSSLFTKLDMTKGYYQIPLTPESKHLTAFSTSLGLYEFNFMPFGLVNAPATFVRMMRGLLKGISNVVSYIDDVCMYTDNFEDHIVLMEKVFNRIRENGLTVKPVKVEIAFAEISFLGHAIRKGIIATDDSIVTKILKIESPKTKKHVQSLLGLLNYYAKFIPCFADKTSMLSSLLKKENRKVIWSDKHQQMLEEIKRMFSSSPILKVPDYKETFVIQTDASNVAISGCLGQYHNGVLHPCFYVSRKLNGAERNYATVELEALAVIYTVSKFKKYLLGKPFIIQSDNQPLKVITTGMPKNARIARWALILQDFTFTVSHIEGKKNCLADLLSRL